MRLLKTVALTGVVIAAAVVLALEPASGASTDKNVAGCADNVMIGHGNAGWRSESNSAGPVGMPKWPLRRMAVTKGGGRTTEASILVEGHASVLVKVPESLRERVFLYYGRGESGKAISFAESNGFSEVEFRPCEDRPRTIWPGGLRVKGEGSVHLVVEAEGKMSVLKLGRPKTYEPRAEVELPTDAAGAQVVA